jgi:hypothetical protein
MMPQCFPFNAFGGETKLHAQCKQETATMHDCRLEVLCWQLAKEPGHPATMNRNSYITYQGKNTWKD